MTDTSVNKYITYRSSKGQEEIIIFSPRLKHQWVAKKFQLEDILGAGLIDMGNVKCIGNSESLNIESRKYIDELIIKGE